QENIGAIRKFEGIVMHPRLVFVDLPKDRRPEVYRFRPPRGEAKGGGGAFHLLGKSKLCSRKNAHRRCGILRRSKPSSTSVKVDCPKLVTDLGRPRFDVVETEVTHGRGTPQTSRSPRPFVLAEPAQNSNRARHCEPLRGGDKPADLPVQQPTKFSVSVGRSTLSVYWPLGRIGDRSDMTHHWASEQSIGIVRHVFVHVRAKGVHRFFYAARARGAGLSPCRGSLRPSPSPPGDFDSDRIFQLNLYFVL